MAPMNRAVLDLQIINYLKETDVFSIVIQWFLTVKEISGWMLQTNCLTLKYKTLLKYITLHGFISVGRLFQSLADPKKERVRVCIVFLIVFYDELEVIFIIISRLIARVEVYVSFGVPQDSERFVSSFFAV